MAVREIAKSQGFTRNLKKLAGKHLGLEVSVCEALETYASQGPTGRSTRIPGLAGAPVFKERLALGDRGRRAGARIIYYCNEEKVVPLFVYVKASQKDIPVNEIRDALKAANLL